MHRAINPLDPTPRWKAELSVGAWTDLAALMLTGTQVEDCGDHLVVRTPANPAFHWGNALTLLDPDAASDTARWLGRFAEAHPHAAHVAIGLPAGADLAAWQAAGLEVDSEEALSAYEPERCSPPQGYATRELRSDLDWGQVVELFCADNAVTRAYPEASYREYAEARAQGRRAAAEAGLGAFFGAFHGEKLVGHAGLLRCGDIGRYQSVLVAAGHRRRGVAAALISASGEWGVAHGTVSQVILTETGSAAGRLYRRLGFDFASPVIGALRAPADA